MSRSLSYLRRALFGIAFVGSLGFGASQALASPADSAARPWCDFGQCNSNCWEQGASGGDCDEFGFCRCDF